VRLREALQHLLNRPLMIREAVLYNEVQPINSYVPARPYENPDSPKNEYDPALAVKLLGEGRWKDSRRAGPPDEERPAAGDGASSTSTSRMKAR